VKRNPPVRATGKHMDKAQKLFRMWHQKHPDEVVDMTFAFPPVVSCIGHAREIMYHSDKWEDDGDFYPYQHTFDSRPLAFLRDGAGKEKSTRTLLGVQDLNGTWAMPLLAYVEALIVDDGQQEHTIRFSDYPVMTCSPDRQTVVILNRGMPVFVRGGEMTVTERGIVK
jgi:hypothetical protein